MSKLKATNDLVLPDTKKLDTSQDYIFYNSAKNNGKVCNVSPTKIGKRPINKFFIDIHRKYFPLRCMLDLGSTSFLISTEATEAFEILVVKRTIPGKASDVGGR